MGLPPVRMTQIKVFCSDFIYGAANQANEFLETITASSVRDVKVMEIESKGCVSIIITYDVFPEEI